MEEGGEGERERGMEEGGEGERDTILYILAVSCLALILVAPSSPRPVLPLPPPLLLPPCPHPSLPGRSHDLNTLMTSTQTHI